jgi:hypothetical protein
MPIRRGVLAPCPLPLAPSLERASMHAGHVLSWSWLVVVWTSGVQGHDAYRRPYSRVPQLTCSAAAADEGAAWPAASSAPTGHPHRHPDSTSMPSNASFPWPLQQLRKFTIVQLHGHDEWYGVPAGSPKPRRCCSGRASRPCGAPAPVVHLCANSSSWACAIIAHNGAKPVLVWSTSRPGSQPCSSGAWCGLARTWLVGHAILEGLQQATALTNLQLAAHTP